MKAYNKYFQPYAEYCVRTTLPEKQLKKALAKECPSVWDVVSLKAVKTAFGFSSTAIFSCNPDNPLHLKAILPGRNSARGEVFIECEELSENATILHITIAPPRFGKYFIWFYNSLALLLGISFAVSVVWWGIFLPLIFICFSFIVLECCHNMAMQETSQLRNNLNNLQKTLESNSSNTLNENKF